MRWLSILALLGIVMVWALLPQSAGSQHQASADVAERLPPGGVYTQGTGFTPILFNDPTLGLTAWVIYQHGQLALTAPKIYCTIAATGAPCTNKNATGAWPLPLNTNPGPLSPSTPGNISTTQLPMYVMDPALPQLYYPAITNATVGGFAAGSVGVGCVNLQTQSNCAYTPLAGRTNVAGQSNVNGVSGFVRAGSNLYGTTTNGLEVCYSMTTHQACTGQPYATNTPPNNDVAGLGPYDYYGTKTVATGRVFTTSNASVLPANHTNPHAPVLSCFDPNSNAPCLGWTTPKVLSSNANVLAANAVYPMFDTSGGHTGVCATTTFWTVITPQVTCFNAAGNSVTPPNHLDTLYPDGGSIGLAMNPLSVTVGGQLQSYFPYYTADRVHPGETLCYNWTVGDRCTQFPYRLQHPAVNGGVTLDYGYAINETCLYGTGDAGFLFSFRADMGQPCESCVALSG